MTNTAILCVDDEHIILTCLREQLSRNFGDEYSYECAENVEEAWEVIEELNQQEIQILVIVSDWLMPGIKGDEFLIQVHKRFPQIVTVMLSGQADETAIERSQEQAALHAFISKPWDELTLVDSIQSGLKKLKLRCHCKSNNGTP
jgi:CheY-like chemotaxis protein